MYAPTPVKRSLWLKELFKSLLIPIVPFHSRARLFYELGSDHNYFTEQSHYLNMGYWHDHPQTLDEACQSMAMLVGEKALLGPEDTVLDVGFGFADQDILWMERFAPRHITGINITPSQVTLARKRIEALHLAHRIDLLLGSATNLSYPDGHFDKVIALECAFHFLTREHFFRESYRVLRPGGRMVIADSIPYPEQLQDLNPLELALYRMSFPIPKENIYTADVYLQKLQMAGFLLTEIVHISEDVYPPLMAYLSRRLQDPEIIQRVNPVIRNMWLNMLKPGTLSHRIAATTDYIIVVADKPV